MKTRTWILGERMLLALTLLTAGCAVKAELISDVANNLSEDLKAITQIVEPGAMIDVIVGSSGPMTAQEQLRIELLVTSLGGTVKDSSFNSFRGYACSIPAYRISDLAQDPASDHLVPDRKVRFRIVD